MVKMQVIIDGKDYHEILRELFKIKQDLNMYSETKDESYAESLLSSVDKIENILQE